MSVILSVVAVRCRLASPTHARQHGQDRCCSIPPSHPRRFCRATVDGSEETRKPIFASPRRINACELIKYHVEFFGGGVVLMALGRLQMHPVASFFPAIFNKPCVPNGRVIVAQAVEADIVLAREKSGVTIEVLYEHAQRDAILLRSVIHQAADREDLRREVSSDERFEDENVVEGILIAAQSQFCQGFEGDVRPHHGMYRRPDCVMLVRVQPRQPQAASLAIALQRVAPFFRHVALVDVVGVVVVRHSNLGGDPQDDVAVALARPPHRGEAIRHAASSQTSFSPRSLTSFS